MLIVKQATQGVRPEDPLEIQAEEVHFYFSAAYEVVREMDRRARLAGDLPEG